MSQPPGCVIDLTTDPDSPQPDTRSNLPASASTRASRLPRYSRDIIDLDPRIDEYGNFAETSRDHGGERDNGDEPIEIEEPDVQIIWASRPHNPVPHHPRPRPTLSRSNGNISYVSMLRDGVTHQHPSGQRSRSSLGDHLQNFHHFWTRAGSEGRQRILEAGGLRQPVRELPHSTNLPPIDLDYDLPGFQMATDPGLPRPPLPTYSSPPPVRPGFTRSPQDDDILVCPNCDEELGSNDDELKRQVWVIKSCGHVRTDPSDALLVAYI